MGPREKVRILQHDSTKEPDGGVEGGRAGEGTFEAEQTVAHEAQAKLCGIVGQRVQCGLDRAV